MKKLTAITLLFAVATMFGINPAVAQTCPMMKKHSEDANKGKHGKMMRKHSDHAKCMKSGMKGRMQGSGMRCPKGPGMMMRGNTGKTVTPTEDGGVVVQLGHKLIKYDEKMNKVGEAKLQLSEEDIRARINHMKKMRETCQEMWEGTDKDETEDKDEGEDNE